MTTTQFRMATSRHQFMLRPDLMVQMTLPDDLTQADAARLSGFVTSLALPDVDQARGGTEDK